MFNRGLKVFFFLGILATVGWSGNKKFGLGFVVGEPTALSAKYWMDGNTALDFAIGWGPGYGRDDDRCWESGYYDRHTSYCNDRGFNHRYRDDRYGYRGIHLHADYLIHNFNLIRSTERLPIYYGPGLNFQYWNYGGPEIGIRGVVGIAWMPKRAPIDLFFEIAPVFLLLPGMDLDMNAGLGARFYF